MAYSHYERLTALDASFLELESTGVHMHVASVGILDPGPLALADGGLDFDQILEVTQAGLFRAPRFRQKLESMVDLTARRTLDERHDARMDPEMERLLEILGYAGEEAVFDSQ